jgi:hypothetical protein
LVVAASSNFIMVKEFVLVVWLQPLAALQTISIYKSYGSFKMDCLGLEHHLVRDPHQFALSLGLKTQRGSDPTRLIRVDLIVSIF